MKHKFNFWNDWIYPILAYQNCVGEVFIRSNGAVDAIELWNKREGEQNEGAL